MSTLIQHRIIKPPMFVRSVDETKQLVHWTHSARDALGFGDVSLAQWFVEVYGDREWGLAKRMCQFPASVIDSGRYWPPANRGRVETTQTIRAGITLAEAVDGFKRVTAAFRAAALPQQPVGPSEPWPFPTIVKGYS